MIFLVAVAEVGMAIRDGRMPDPGLDVLPLAVAPVVVVDPEAEPFPPLP